MIQFQVNLKFIGASGRCKNIYQINHTIFIKEIDYVEVGMNHVVV